MNKFIFANGHFYDTLKFDNFYVDKNADNSYSIYMSRDGSPRRHELKNYENKQKAFSDLKELMLYIADGNIYDVDYKREI